MPVSVDSLTVYLGARSRGAPDDLRAVVDAELRSASGITLATQQLSDVEAVAVLAARRRSGASVTVLLEADYLRESRPVPASQLWSTRAGTRTTQRGGLNALLRSAVDVRLDHIWALQHINLAVLDRHTGPARVLLSSANLTAGNLDRYLNWAAVIADDTAAAAATAGLAAALDGDFRGLDHEVSVRPDTRLVLSATGAVPMAVIDLIATARRSIDLAVFNISTASHAVDALTAAALRGVQVRGVVDGDQSGQAWDAVAALRRAGADIRYHPGALTGGLGRMHLKALVVDDISMLSTANLSASAHTSLELAVLHTTPGPLNDVLRAEITRLYRQASPTPLPVVPR